MFALILMIRNEEKILKRCLEAVENVVDCFCICDTGSTDKSVEIATEFLKTHKGCLTHEPWKNFGYNRTVSFQNAQTYIKKKLKWDTSKVYGLLLDADMVFVSKNLKEQNLTEIGYKIIQINGCLEYYNCRFVRMDYAWKCVGVTHEYWDGPTINLPKSICYIDDVNDGGCKDDKYERDEKLLRQGLVDEPENVRYLFYLAQTLKCCRRYEESIKFYKQRIKAGGWHEEVWYSYYMIGECYLNLKNIINFEKWMQLAYQYHPARAESLNKLTEHYRIHGLHYKAFHYARIGDSIPFPKNDILFVESDIYNGKFLYEKSILDYYVNQDKKIGVRDSFNYLLKNGNNINNVISNLKFYVSPLQGTITKLDLPHVFGDDFRPSAISLHSYPYANIRYVNYKIQPDGSYVMPNGIVVTKNAYVNLETKEFYGMEEPLVKFETHIKGLEDLRLYANPNGKLCFTATSFKQYIQDKISIVHGEYDLATRMYKNYQGIQSPTNSDCEKNWVNIPGTDDFIYSWNPLKIGKIRDDRFIITKQINTPPLFSLFRGSAPPIEVNKKWIALVHFVEYCQPRKYYHCLVELEKETYTVLKVSLPFVFKNIEIEYCISGRLLNDSLEYYFSSWDKDSSKIIFKPSDVEWIKINDPTVKEKNNIVRVPPNVQCYWSGNASRCYPNGEIEKYVNKSINKQKLNISAIWCQSDGNETPEFYKNLEDKKLKDTVPVLSALCIKHIQPNVLLMPLDDSTFKNGLNLPYDKTWKERKNILFWRGSASGRDVPSLRTQVVNKLINNTNADVKYIIKDGLNANNIVPPTHIADFCDFSTFFNYKYLLIVDGNTVASNHQWVFGSKSVPLMITHPENNWWFKKFLKPMENYVPINYDLSDLEEKLQWLVDNDNKAEKIAENAFSFSKLVFSSEFQRKYIDDELKRLSHNSNSTIVSMFFNLKKLPDSTDSVRPIEFYLEHGKKTLELPYPMVLFCDEETRPLLEKIRGELPTTYIEKNITEYDYFKELYPKVVENRKVIPSPDARNTSSYFLLCMFKLHALNLAKQGNYYPDTSHYFWIDLGGSHVMRGFPDAVHRMLDNPRPRISCGYIHYRPDSELFPMKEFMKAKNNCCIGGTCFSVESEYVERYYNDIFEILNEQISLGVGHTDEQCIAYSYSKNPQWFNLYFADYYSLVTNYHETVEDIQCVKTNFINIAKNAGRTDLVELAINSIKK